MVIYKKMKIPLKAQIFDSSIVISDKDRERLEPHLSGWNHLHEVFLLGINVPDLKRLIILELLTKNRTNILNRLLARLAKVEKQELKNKIHSWLQSSKVP